MPVTKYIWDGEDCLMETDGTGTVQTVYTYEPEQYGNLISSRVSGTTYYHHYDALGSTRQLSNAAGVISDTWIYDAWGNTVARTGATAIFLQWVGQVGYYYDSETGTFWVRERPLEPANARWTTVDPLEFIDGLPRYTYAQNSPLTRTDPSGMQSIEELIEKFIKSLDDLSIANAQKECKLFVNKNKDLKWAADLPDCPCFTCGLTGNPLFEPLKKADDFHPGADECTRSSINAIKNTFGLESGQQCCYQGGALITKGPGAGTPDRHSPSSGFGALNHWLHDVRPFLICRKAGMVDEYLKVRPPNKGGANDCEEFEAIEE
jgi:RHS repeat-associated protein